MSKPPIIFSPRWWRLLFMIVREWQRTPRKESLAVPHHDFAGLVLDPSHVLAGKRLASVEVSVRADDKATVKLVCSDGSYLSFGLGVKS